MPSRDQLLTLAEECHAEARVSSNPLIRAQFKVMGDDYRKQAEELQDDGVVIRCDFAKHDKPH